MPGQACGINMATTLGEKLWKKPAWETSSWTQWQLRYQHASDHEKDTDSSTDLALISPRIAPRLSAETLTPHGNDHLQVVPSLQKPAKNQSTKLHNPFWHERSVSDIVSNWTAPARTKNTKKDKLLIGRWLPNTKKKNKLAYLCYNCLNSTAPVYWTAEPLTAYKPTRQMRWVSSDTSILRLSSVRTHSLGQRSFSVLCRCTVCL